MIKFKINLYRFNCQILLGIRPITWTLRVTYCFSEVSKDGIENLLEEGVRRAVSQTVNGQFPRSRR